jgi:hypothetical protein
VRSCPFVEVAYQTAASPLLDQQFKGRTKVVNTGSHHIEWALIYGAGVRRDSDCGLLLTHFVSFYSSLYAEP